MDYLKKMLEKDEEKQVTLGGLFSLVVLLGLLCALAVIENNISAMVY